MAQRQQYKVVNRSNLTPMPAMPNPLLPKQSTLAAPETPYADPNTPSTSKAFPHQIAHQDSKRPNNAPLTLAETLAATTANENKTSKVPPPLPPSTMKPSTSSARTQPVPEDYLKYAPQKKQTTRELVEEVNKTKFSETNKPVKLTKKVIHSSAAPPARAAAPEPASEDNTEELGKLIIADVDSSLDVNISFEGHDRMNATNESDLLRDDSGTYRVLNPTKRHLRTRTFDSSRGECRSHAKRQFFTITSTSNSLKFSQNDLL